MGDGEREVLVDRADEMSEIQEIRKSNANKYKSLSISIKRILSSSYHESNQHYKYL